MTKGTIVQLMATACQYLQDKLKDGTLPKSTFVSISISDTEIIITGNSYFPDDKKRCEFRLTREGDEWYDDTHSWNKTFQAQGVLYDPDAEKQT